MKKNIFSVFIAVLFCLLVLSPSAEPIIADASDDLAVESITISPSWTSQVVNRSANITVKVKNNGTSDIDAAQYLVNYTKDFTNFVVTQAPSPSGILAAGTYFYYNFIGSFTTPGDAKLVFSVDSINALAETNEENNSIEKTVSVVSSEYDLAVSSITLNSPSILVNKEAVITVKVKNNGLSSLISPNGTMDFSHTFKNFSIMSAQYPEISLNSPVAPGSEYTFVFNGKFISAGSQALTFIIDSKHLLEETNETNNALDKTVTVASTQKTDLSATALIVDAGEFILANSEVNISITVKNNGESSLIDSAGLADNEVLTSLIGFNATEKTHDVFPTVTNPLDPLETFKYYFKGNFSITGPKLLTFKVDKDNLLGDANLGDNATSTSVTIFSTAAERDDFAFSDVRTELVSTTSVKVYWKTSKITTGKISGAVGGVFSDSLTGKDHFATAIGLPNSINYEYKITGVNGAVTKESAAYNVKLPVNDNLSLITEPKAVVDGTNKTVKISWATNLIANGSAYYRKPGDINFSQANDSASAVNHNLTITLTDAGIYDYFVISTSTAGTAYKSGLKFFTIAFTSSAENSGNSNSENSSTGTASANDSSGESAVTSNEQQIAVQTAAEIKNSGLYRSLKGKIVLKVESNGEAYWIDPSSQNMYYLGRPADAFSVMRQNGIGVKSADLEKIPLGLSALTGIDTDKDTLPDIFEDAIGTDKNKKDTDADGFDDKAELNSGYSPKISGAKVGLNLSFAASQKGRILLQVEGHGEAWYINPADGKRYFLGRPADAFAVMRKLGLGISTANFNALQ